MKAFIFAIAMSFSLISVAGESARVLAMVTRNLKSAEKVELIGIDIGSSNARYLVVTTDNGGTTQTNDVTQFSSYISITHAYLLEKDRVPVDEVTRNFICYLGSPDYTSTLFVERYSRKNGQGGLEKILEHYGCQSPQPTQPLNEGDFVVAEGLLHFIKAVSGQ